MLSGLFFFYANSLLKRGAEKSLEQADLWDVAPQHRSEAIYGHYKLAMARTANANRFPHVRWLISRAHCCRDCNSVAALVATGILHIECITLQMP